MLFCRLLGRGGSSAFDILKQRVGFLCWLPDDCRAGRQVWLLVEESNAGENRSSGLVCRVDGKK